MSDLTSIEVLQDAPPPIARATSGARRVEAYCARPHRQERTQASADRLGGPNLLEHPTESSREGSAAQASRVVEKAIEVEFAQVLFEDLEGRTQGGEDVEMLHGVEHRA